MLLLLLPELFPNLTRTELVEFNLTDLFEIRTGIIEDKYSNAVQDNPDLTNKISFLRLSSFNDMNGLIDFDNLGSKKQKSDSNRINTSPENIASKKENEKIPANRLLDKHDFLISTRGIPKGYSLLKSYTIKDIYAVATHHFISLRPRMKLLNMHVPFLHLMLEVMVKMQLRQLFNVRKVQEEGKIASFNSIKINDLSSIKISIPTDMLEQVRLFNEYNILQENLRKAQIKEEEFENQFNEFINFKFPTMNK